MSRQTPGRPETQESADRAAETRARILEAALREFSANGLAGARTEQIAVAAGVNKALLYYYFESKEKLYLAALELVATRVRESTMAVLMRQATPGERLLRAALNHFDRILTQRQFQTLMQQEMMRVHRGEQGALPMLIDRVFRPVFNLFESIVREGIATGELIETDWLQMILAGLGANVFYFLSAPVWQMVLAFDPFDARALRLRRVALVEFLGQAVFRNRSRGAELAARVLADTPAPPDGELKKFEVKSK
jgi:TetR/AcrR family transcriptional regulator